MTVRLNEIPGVILPRKSFVEGRGFIGLTDREAGFNQCLEDQGQVSLTLNIKEAARVIFNDKLAIAAVIAGLSKEEYQGICTRIAQALSDNLSKLLIRAEEK